MGVAKRKRRAAPRAEFRRHADAGPRIPAGPERPAGRAASRAQARRPRRAERARAPRRRRGAQGRKPASRASEERRPPKARAKRGGSGGGRGRSLLGRLVYWTVVLGLWAGIAGIGLVVWVGAHLPPIQSLEVPKRPPGIQILGIGGATLATRGEMGGAAVPLKELPKYLPQAFLAIEDRRFYDHFGIDPIGVVRALAANAMHRGVSQGGSTLTQQLAKNLFSDAGAHLSAQAAGAGARVLAGAQIQQAADPRALPQPRLFRRRRLRRRGRRAALLRQVGAQRDAVGSRDAGRAS